MYPRSPYRLRIISRPSSSAASDSTEPLRSGISDLSWDRLIPGLADVGLKEPSLGRASPGPPRDPLAVQVAADQGEHDPGRDLEAEEIPSQPGRSLDQPQAGEEDGRDQDPPGQEERPQRDGDQELS